MIFKIGVYKNFVVFTEEHLCWSLFLILIFETPTQMFSCKHWEIFKNKYFYRTSPVAASLKTFLVSFDKTLNISNACTQDAIRFFIAKYEILTVAPKLPFIFLRRDTTFCSCTQTAIRFTAKCKVLKSVPKRPFVFLGEIINLEWYPNCHSFFDYKIRSCSETVICFLTANQKI